MEVSSEVQTKLDQLFKLPKAVRVGAVCGIALMLGVGYFFGHYKSAMEELSRLNAQEQELERKLSEVRSITSNLKAFEEEIAGLEIQLKLALRQLPNKKELEVLLTDINNLGKTAGVEILSFTRNSEVTHDFYAEVPIKISLEGAYHDLGEFFALLAGLPRIVNMSGLAISVSSETLAGTRLSVTGTATVFRFVGSSAGA